MGETLAIDGGNRTIDEKIPPLVRWDDLERRQLAEMIDQRSLFYWEGPQTLLLVERFQQRYPLKWATPCSSGTAAIHIAVAAAGIGPGDEVIVPPITDMGTVIGVLYQQGVPIFADLDPHSYNLDPADVERKVTPRTRAIIAVHLAGNPCDMAALRKIADRHNLVLIEDCAQAWGAQYRGRPVGTIGHIGCFSLNDFKHIGCGDGGVVATSEERFGPLLQKFSDKAYDRVGGTRNVDVLAPNYRISEPQSAIAAVQLTRLESIVQRRRSVGELLGAQLQNIPGVAPHAVSPEDFCSYWFYMFRIEPERFTCDRDRFAAALAAEGVTCWAGYIADTLYQRPIFTEENFFAGRWPVKQLGLTDVDYKKVCCPTAEAIIKTGIHVTIREHMPTSYIEGIGQAVRKVAGHFAK